MDRGAAAAGAAVAAAARGAAADPTVVPHRWQNLAPGVSRALQLPQCTPRRAAPHSLQNFPWEVAPQLGQGALAAGEEDMSGRYTRRAPGAEAAAWATALLPPPFFP